jgi:hypothetical protein
MKSIVLGGYGRRSKAITWSFDGGCNGIKD